MSLSKELAGRLLPDSFRERMAIKASEDSRHQLVCHCQGSNWSIAASGCVVSRQCKSSSTPLLRAGHRKQPPEISGRWSEENPYSKSVWGATRSMVVCFFSDTSLTSREGAEDDPSGTTALTLATLFSEDEPTENGSWDGIKRSGAFRLLQ